MLAVLFVSEFLMICVFLMSFVNCRSVGVPVKGRKTELVDALRAYLSSNPGGNVILTRNIGVILLLLLYMCKILEGWGGGH